MLKPCNKRRAVVLQHMPWSPRPFKVEYFDELGNKYIEQFTAQEIRNAFNNLPF